MKITHKKTLLFFLLLIASIFNSYLFSQALNYRKTIHVTTKGQVIPLEQCYYNKLPPLESDIGRTRFVVDNGVEFFIKLPEDIVVDSFEHTVKCGERSVLQGNMIKILGNGYFRLFFHNNKKERYYIGFHVNYKGVLQYKGQNAPEEIEVSEENENETLSVPNNSFAATLWSFSTNKSSGFTDFYESGHKPSLSLKIKDIIKSSLSKIDIVNGELIIKTEFYDDTSNAIYKDEKKEDIIGGGASFDFVILKIKNKAKRLDLSTEEVNFTNYGGSQTVEVATDHSYGYTVTKEKDCYWLDVVKEGNTIKINARSNGTASNLESFITVRSVGITKKIKVTMQASATQIDVGYTSLSFPVEGGSNDVSVVSNANWKVYSDVDWIKAHDNYFMLNSISLEVDKNLSGERIGHVIIEANGVKKTITIFQEGKPAVLDISTNSMVFNNGGELKEAKVNSNTNWDVTTDAKWLTINPKKGKGDDFIQIYAEPNESDLQRKAKVTISGGSEQRIIEITQEGKLILSISNNELNFSETENKVKVTILTNSTWKALISDEWVKMNNTSGGINSEQNIQEIGEIEITVEKNTSITKRHATITIVSGKLEKTIRINQEAGKPIIEVSDDVLNFTHKGGTKNIIVNSNVEWNAVVYPKEWTRISKHSVSGREVIKVEVDENKELDDRDAIITIRYGIINEKIIRIKQKALKIDKPKNLEVVKIYQRDAVIRWEAGADEKEWEVVCEDKKILTKETKAVIRGLEPNSVITIRIKAITEDGESEEIYTTATTKGMSNDNHLIPTIFVDNEVDKDGYIVVESGDFMVFWHDLINEMSEEQITYKINKDVSEEEGEYKPLGEKIEFTKGKYVLNIKIGNRYKIVYLVKVE